MRVYLPVTASQLAAAWAEQEVRSPVHTVTAQIREWYVSGDLEELEYAAMTEAAGWCLRLLAGSADEPPRRVVLAADVDDGVVGPWPQAPVRSAARLLEAVPWRRVVSIHVDEADAEPAVAAAVDVWEAAEDGDDDASFLVDEAQACDLLWFDVTEIEEVLRDLRHGR